jgi:hypothetical protein
LQIVDPYLASYRLDEPILSMVELTRATMSKELQKITLDKKFIWKHKLNYKTVV